MGLPFKTPLMEAMWPLMGAHWGMSARICIQLPWKKRRCTMEPVPVTISIPKAEIPDP